MTKKKSRPKLKTFNVFYTLQPPEYEAVVRARSPQDAVDRVTKILEAGLQEVIAGIRSGWEIRK